MAQGAVGGIRLPLLSTAHTGCSAAGNPQVRRRAQRHPPSCPLMWCPERCARRSRPGRWHLHAGSRRPIPFHHRRLRRRPGLHHPSRSLHLHPSFRALPPERYMDRLPVEVPIPRQIPLPVRGPHCPVPQLPPLQLRLHLLQTQLPLVLSRYRLPLHQLHLHECLSVHQGRSVPQRRYREVAHLCRDLPAPPVAPRPAL